MSSGLLSAPLPAANCAIEKPGGTVMPGGGVTQAVAGEVESANGTAPAPSTASAATQRLRFDDTSGMGSPSSRNAIADGIAHPCPRWTPPPFPYVAGIS